jgi:peptidoglycan/LPS O-acetylase OafA/YrhL
MPYIPALDGIRAIAAMLVILLHAYTPGLFGAYLGVDLFFVLSGFLITSLLLKEQVATGSIHLGRFYWRRVKRLMPPLICVLVLYLLIAPVAWPAYSHHERDVLIAFAYLSDLGSLLPGLPKMLRHTWSLAVEQHYYLIWPVLLLFVLRVFPRQIIPTLSIFFIAATLWRMHALFNGDTWESIYYQFDFRLSGLMLGSLLAASIHFQPDFSPPRAFLTVPITVAGIISIVTLNWNNPYGLLIGITLAEMLAVILIMVALAPDGSAFYRFLEAGPTVYLGRISYGLYLYHYPIFYFLREHFEWHITLMIGLPLSIVLASLSYYYLEKEGDKRAAMHAFSQRHVG